MHCPNCNHELKEVSAKSHYRALIKLNQCYCCGGIWFNDWELFSLDDAEAKKLDNIDAEKFKAACNVSLKQKFCPECNESLEKFRDANIPEEIDIESCRKCGGFWLNRGETSEYKEYQQNKIQQSLLRQEKTFASADNNNEFTRRINSLLESERSDVYSSIGRLGSFLSTPISSLSMESIKKAEGNNDDYVESKSVFLAIEILSAILRLLIGR